MHSKAPCVQSGIAEAVADLDEEIYKAWNRSQGIWPSNDVHSFGLEKFALQPLSHAAYDSKDCCVASSTAVTYIVSLIENNDRPVLGAGHDVRRSATWMYLVNRLSSPIRENTFCSALSRMEHVFSRMTLAPSGSGVSL